MRVKIFDVNGSYPPPDESIVNEWLSENHIARENVVMSTAAGERNNFFVTILYDEREVERIKRDLAKMEEHLRTQATAERMGHTLG